MKLIFSILLSFTICYSSTISTSKTIKFITFAETFCKQQFNESFKLCKDVAHSIDSREDNLTANFVKVFSKHAEYVKVKKILESRVSKNETNLIINSSQTLENLDIGQNGQLNIEKIDFGNSTIDEKINLDPSIAFSTPWTNYQLLDEIVNQTRQLKESIQSSGLIVETQIVWINESVRIDGACCLIANISLASSQQMIADDLKIDNDSYGDWLDGQLSWGFYLLSDLQNKDNLILDDVTFTQPLQTAALDTPSIDLKNAVRKESEDHSPIKILGKVTFNQLQLETVTIHENDLESPNSLLSTIHLDGKKEYDLCNLDLNSVEISSLLDPKISGTDLTELLTVDREQYARTSTIALKGMQLDGSKLTIDDEFSVKLVEKLNNFLEMDSVLHYETLNLNTINVTDLMASTWDEWIMINSNESYQFDNVIFNGSIKFIHINDINYDYDLVKLDDRDIIKSKLIFDNLILSADMAYKLFPSEIPMDNWDIQGDLIIKGDLNNKNWDKLTNDLISLRDQTDYLKFNSSVNASECNFDTIDEINTIDLMKIHNISAIKIFKNLQIDDLFLDEVNVTSCLLVSKDQIISDKLSPINQLNVINLTMKGNINTIESKQFLVNLTDQDFTRFNSSLDCSNLSFGDLNIKNSTLFSTTNINISELNGISLNRLLRADPKQKWPETMTLSNSNISNLTVPSLTASLSNILLNETDQIIPIDIKFENRVDFIKNVILLNNNSIINFRIVFGNNGDIIWTNLVIYGNLTVNHNFYVLDSLTSVNITQGVTMVKDLTIKKTVNSLDEDIYSNLNWKVYQKSNFLSFPDLTIKNLFIEKDLTINNNSEAIPWLNFNSLDGIEYYQKIILNNLVTSFMGNVNYQKLESNSNEINLDDVADLTSDQLDLHFDDGVTIKGNLSTDKDVEINLIMLKF